MVAGVGEGKVAARGTKRRSSPILFTTNESKSYSFLTICSLSEAGRGASRGDLLDIAG